MSFYVTSETREVEILMDELRERAENPEDLLERVGKTLQERAAHRFETGGEGDWPKLAQSSKDKKQRKGWNPEILVATGALRDSYTIRGAGGSIFEISNGRLKFGSSLPYASRHQFGDSRVPKRQVLVVDEELELEIIRDALEDFDF